MHSYTDTHGDMHAPLRKHTYIYGHTCALIPSHLGTHALIDMYTNVHTNKYTQS